MTGATREHLGSGWRFPVRIGPRGGLVFSRGEADVEEAIWILLGTAPGERAMRPELGCGIHDYVFAPNSPATRGSIAHEVRVCLTRYEPRIEVETVRVEAPPEEPEKLLIRIDYRVRSTNASHNLVYPFYIREGAGG
jgi:phage baseplate assembly protein W